jgi:hypothetical protein
MASEQNWERQRKYKITYTDGTSKIFFCTHTDAMNIFNAEGSNVVDLTEEPTYGKRQEDSKESDKEST